MRVQTSHGMVTHALTTFKDMIQAGHAPTLFHFTALVTACGRAKPHPLLDTAQALYQDLLRRQLAPDVIFFAALIDTLAKGGAWCGDALPL